MADGDIGVSVRSGVSRRVIEDRATLSLKAGPRADVSAAATALGVALPPAGRSATRGGVTVLSIGPRQWLLRCAATEAEATIAGLQAALAGVTASVSALSDGLYIVQLDGRDAEATLAKGTTLDLAAMSAGDVSRTRLGQVAAVLRRETETRWAIAVARPYHRYLEQWLDHASREFLA